MYSYLKGKIVVSIHAPHEGERLIENLSAGFCQGLFQSTLPTRGSDLPLSSLPSSCLCFNPRSPRGGATSRPCRTASPRSGFNPRSPRGGATPNSRTTGAGQNVSIHAPHEGERLEHDLNDLKRFDVSIHAPHEGERRSARLMPYSWSLVSIHAPHEGERRRP